MNKKALKTILAALLSVSLLACSTEANTSSVTTITVSAGGCREKVKVTVPSHLSPVTS